jgi:hypothetical protein
MRATASSVSTLATSAAAVIPYCSLPSAARSSASLPMKPENGGIPASDSAQIANSSATPGRDA